MAGSKTCGLVDECKYNNGECSQVCVDTYDSYYCTCRRGYRLARNEYSCPGKLSQSISIISTISYNCQAGIVPSARPNVLFIAASSHFCTTSKDSRSHLPLWQHFLANREVSSGCYLFTVSNPGLLFSNGWP